MIISAIDVVRALFCDPITVSIRFRFSGFSWTAPPWISSSGRALGDPSTRLGSLHKCAQSQWFDRERHERECNAANECTVDNHTVSRCQWPVRGVETSLVMFADGSLGVGGPYDGIITMNSFKPVQFTRPVEAGNFDAQMFTEHEIDEGFGLASHLGGPIVHAPLSA